jgi:hypothetical protein
LRRVTAVIKRLTGLDHYDGVNTVDKKRSGSENQKEILFYEVWLRKKSKVVI